MMKSAIMKGRLRQGAFEPGFGLLASPQFSIEPAGAQPCQEVPVAWAGGHAEPLEVVAVSGGSTARSCARKV